MTDDAESLRNLMISTFLDGTKINFINKYLTILCICLVFNMK